MDTNNLDKLLDKLSAGSQIPKDLSKHDRVLLVDGLNLFLRCFAAINHISPQGSHVGGLGGFLRSLGFLVQKVQPTSIYVVFDGEGSSINRKNVFSEYKSGRGSHQITNWEAFNSVEEELDSKVNQISRLIHYLKCLPIKIVSLDKVEADDIIAYLSNVLSNSSDKAKICIVSSDKDFIQLASSKIIIYRPQEKKFWDDKTVIKNYKILPKNLIIHKTLVGDQSDKIPGVKGLGKKKILNLFPELSERELSMDDIYEISSQKYKENLLYAKIILNFNDLKKYYAIMDLSNPLLNDKQIGYLNSVMEENVPQVDIPSFCEMYETDGIGRLIDNPQQWVRSNFSYLYNFNS